MAVPTTRPTMIASASNDPPAWVKRLCMRRSWQKQPAEPIADAISSEWNGQWSINSNHPQSGKARAIEDAAWTYSLPAGWRSTTPPT
jgi:hypothetical protein